MPDQVVGTCSNCGGAMILPAVWLGVQPAVPTCRSCGGKPKNAYGPIIEVDASGNTAQLLNETR